MTLEHSDTPTPPVVQSTQPGPSEADLLAQMSGPARPADPLKVAAGIEVPQSAPEAPKSDGAPSLDDALEGPGAGAKPQAPVIKNPGKLISDDQILGIVGSIFARGFDPLTREDFIQRYREDELVKLGLEFADLAGALGELGISVGSPTMSPYLKLAIGAGALIGGGVLLRQSYGFQNQDPRITVRQAFAQDPELVRETLEQLGYVRGGGGFEPADVQPSSAQSGEEVASDFAI